MSDYSIILHGCSGHMGSEVEKAAAALGLKIVAGIDPVVIDKDYPVYKTAAELPEELCGGAVLIDFSTAKAIPALLDMLEGRRLPSVIATTGIDAVGLERMHRIAEHAPVFFSRNMSFGVNLLLKLVKEAAAAAQGYDAEIVETHHNRKIDSPSGTALMLAEGIASVREGSEIVTGRTPESGKRQSGDIGVSSVRGGTMPGEHSVFLFGTDEVIELKHTAYSRAIFAQGAIKAAGFIADKENGFYTMEDML